MPQLPRQSHKAQLSRLSPESTVAALPASATGVARAEACARTHHDHPPDAASAARGTAGSACLPAAARLCGTGIRGQRPVCCRDLGERVATKPAEVVATTLFWLVLRAEGARPYLRRSRSCLAAPKPASRDAAPVAAMPSRSTPLMTLGCRRRGRVPCAGCTGGVASGRRHIGQWGRPWPHEQAGAGTASNVIQQGRPVLSE